MREKVDDCIFCKIAAGDIPCHKIYEDQLFLAFLDIKPFTQGHTLLIPKSHTRWIWDISDDQLHDFYAVGNKIAKNLQEKLDVPSVMSMTFGELVPHTHLHIIPRSKPIFSERLSELLNSERSSPEHSELATLSEQLMISS